MLDQFGVGVERDESIEPESKRAAAGVREQVGREPPEEFILAHVVGRALEYPSFGYDGKHVVYLRQISGLGYDASSIEVIDLDTRTVHVVDGQPAIRHSPFFTPDGLMIVYVETSRLSHGL